MVPLPSTKERIKYNIDGQRQWSFFKKSNMELWIILKPIRKIQKVEFLSISGNKVKGTPQVNKLLLIQEIQLCFESQYEFGKLNVLEKFYGIDAYNKKE